MTKVYRSRGQGDRQGVVALDGIDLTIETGSIFGLLGPNGAGKSTFINILAGLVFKTAGSVRLWDFDIAREPRRSRSAIGVVPQELNMDPFFTPREMLDIQAGLYGVPPRERQTGALLAAVGLADKADAYARTLSGGMRRRLMVAKAMVHSPPILVLDEPTAGVDVELRRQLWNHVRSLNRAGTTIILTTHYLQEAEELCDRIGIIDHGRLVACDHTRTLVGQFDHKELSLVLDRPIERLPDSWQGINVVRREAQSLVIRYQPSRFRIDQMLEALRALGYGILDLSTDEADLEDVFLRLTQDDREGLGD